MRRLTISMLGALSMAAGAPTGQIAPEFIAPDGASCEFEAESDDGRIATSGGTKPVSVDPGRYRVRAHCDVGDQHFAPPSVAVKVRAGRDAEPRIVFEAARVRVESRRGGVLIESHIDLYDSGTNFKGPARARVPSNQTVTIASGRYDLIVATADSPRAEVAFRNVRIGAKKKKVLTADLSDGGVIVAVLRDNKKADAAIRAFVPGQKRDVGLVAPQEELRLPPGRYRIETELTDSIDFAKSARELWIRPRKVERLKQRFDTGKLSVTVTADRLPTSAVVRLSHAGDKDFFNYFDAPDTVTLSPGLYDLTIVSDAAGPLGAQRLEGVRVKKRGHERKSIDLTRATLTVRVTKNRRPVDFAEVVVRAAGGGDRIRPEANGAFRLWPGRYEVTATLESGDVATDGPFRVELDQRLTRELRFDRAAVTVTARRGKQVVAASVAVYRPGAAKPLATGRTDDAIEVVPGTYDIKVTAGADVKWKQGVRLKRTHRVRVKLPVVINDDLPEGDLPEGDLPEGE